MCASPVDTAGASGLAAPAFAGARSALLQLRWADTDAYRHINNVAYVRYLEETRIRLFGLPDAPETAASLEPPVFSGLDGNTFVMVAAQRLEYLSELNYTGQSIQIDVWIARLGSKSLDLGFELHNGQGAPGSADRRIHLRATTTVVFCATDTRAPRALTERERLALAPHVGAAIPFRS
ncbi:MAG: acyl-CoA thioester hydrolase [Subtercola sp.]|nr:acyl-CoA thioester hydrolase [Subtercola sp.]